MSAQTNNSYMWDSESLGTCFVQRYYNLMHSEPHNLHKFYRDESVLTYIPSPSSEPITANGQKAIQNAWSNLPLVDCRVNLSQGTLTTQESRNNGLIVAINGTLSNNGLPYRRFAQTFILAEQKNGFYILNDVLHFLEEDQSPPTSNHSNTYHRPQEQASSSHAYYDERVSSHDQHQAAPQDVHSRQHVVGVMYEENPPQDENTVQRHQAAPMDVHSQQHVVGDVYEEDLPQDEQPFQMPKASSYAAAASFVSQGELDAQLSKFGIRTENPTPAAVPERKPVVKEVRRIPAIDTTSVFLTGWDYNLPDDYVATELRKQVVKHGKVVSIDIKGAKKYGFIDFDSCKSVEIVLGMDLYVKEKRINVDPGKSGKRSGGASYHRDYDRSDRGGGGGGGRRGGR